MAKDAKKPVTVDQLSAVATKVKTWGKNNFVEDVTLSSGKIQKTINGTTTDVATIPTSLPNPNSLKLQAGGTDKVTYDGSSSATLNIASGSSNGTISVGGTDVSVTGLGSLAYVNSLSASDVNALPSTTMYAGSSTAGGAATSAAKLTNTSRIGDTNKPVYFTAEGVPVAISHTIDADVPSNAVFTDTDTKVTSAANHYTPSADNNSELTATIDGTAGSYAINTEYTVLTGVKAQRDAKGHVTGLTYTAQKIKDTTVANTDRYVNSASFADDTTSNSGSPVKMTLTRAGSDSATVTGNIPAVSSSSAGVAPKGAAVSTQNQSTKFLREDGTWAAPSYTTNTNTTYGLSINGSTNGDSNGTSLGTIYAPTTAGTSGYVLTSNGSGAPTWAAASGGGNIDYTTTTSNIQNIDATIISTALRKTAQTLTAAEKTQVKTNLGITISTSAPTSSDGEDGDIWLVYEA